MAGSRGAGYFSAHHSGCDYVDLEGMSVKKVLTTAVLTLFVFGLACSSNNDDPNTGTYDAMQLTSDITYATVRGTAFGDLNVSDSLYAIVLGCGRIEFTGGADLVNIFVSECGSVRRK